MFNHNMFVTSLRNSRIYDYFNFSRRVPAYAYWEGRAEWHNAFPITRQGRVILRVTRLRCEYARDSRRWYRRNCSFQSGGGKEGENWRVSSREDLARNKILAREDETMATAETKLLTLRRIKATSRLRDRTRNTETSCIQRARRMHRCTRIR